MSDATAPRQPFLRVVRGTPTEEELAALVAVLAARAATPPVAGPAATTRWNGRASLLRRTLAPGQGAWRFSGLPG